RRIKDLEERIPKLQAETRKLEATRTSMSESEAVIRRVEQELQDRDRLEKEARAASEEATRLSVLLTENAFAPELVRTVGELNQQLARLSYDTEQALEADRQIQRLRGVEKQHAEL